MWDDAKRKKLKGTILIDSMSSELNADSDYGVLKLKKYNNKEMILILKASANITMRYISIFLVIIL